MAAFACATGDKHAAVAQERCGVIYARGGERGASARGLRFRIEDFGHGDEIPGAVASTGDQNAAIGQRGRGVTCARNSKGIELLYLMRT